MVAIVLWYISCQAMAQIRLEPPATGTFNFRTPDEWLKWNTVSNSFGHIRAIWWCSQGTDKYSAILYWRRSGICNVIYERHAQWAERLWYRPPEFEDFFKVHQNIFFDWAQFNCCNQLEGETSEHYIMELYQLSESCDYGGRLVVGIVSQQLQLQLQLQLDAGLTLEIANKRIRQRESVD